MAALVHTGLIAEGYEVDLVDNGMDGLLAATGNDYAAAAIDVMLPGMTGFEICRHLRSSGSRLPVLLLTARDSIEDRVFGLDAGADDYLIKPFAFAELSARIRALVRRDSSAPKPTLTVGNVTLDTATVRASIGGRPLALSTKEFSLLRLLGSNAGTVLDRDRILDEVWGTTKNIDPTIVDQYVSYLRRKLEQAHTGFAISTVRGVGYSLVVEEVSR